jgi:hypothetical protein
MQSMGTTEESMRSFVAAALVQDPEASSKQIAVRWRSLRGEEIGVEELDLLSDMYERQAPAAHDANAEVRAAQHRIDSPPFRVIPQEIVGLVVAFVPFLLPVESINAAGRSYFSLTGVIGGVVAILLATAVVRFAMRGGSTVRVKVAHAALGSAILLVGVYHVLHGIGVLHTVGLYRF